MILKINDEVDELGLSIENIFKNESLLNHNLILNLTEEIYSIPVKNIKELEFGVSFIKIVDNDINYLYVPLDIIRLIKIEK